MNISKDTQISLGLLAGAIFAYVIGSALVTKGWSSIDLSGMHFNLFLLTGRHVGPVSMDFGLIAAIGVPVILLILTAVFATKAIRNTGSRILPLVTLATSICLLGMAAIGFVLM